MFTTPLLEGYPEIEHQQVIEHWCEVKLFTQGQPIVLCQDDGTELFIVLSGEVEAVITEDYQVPFTMGQVFGEMSFIDGEKRSALVRARTDAKIAVLSKEAMTRTEKLHPEIALLIWRNLATTVAAHLRQSNEEIKHVNRKCRGAIEREAPLWFQRATNWLTT